MADHEIHIEGVVKRATDKAYLVDIDEIAVDNYPEEVHGVEVWLPKSQLDCDDDLCEGEILETEIPEWLAREKDLI